MLEAAGLQTWLFASGFLKPYQIHELMETWVNAITLITHLRRVTALFAAIG